MANVYKANYTNVSVIGPEGEKQRISKDGTVNVLADDPTSAGDAVKAAIATESTVEVNIHLVAEIAKNVLIPEAQRQALHPLVVTTDTPGSVDDVAKKLVDSASAPPTDAV